MLAAGSMAPTTVAAMSPGRALLAVLVVVPLASLVGCSPDSDPERFGPECDAVRERARAASAAGNQLRSASPSPGSADSGAVERTARDYVAAVRSQPGCFSVGQRENAEEIASGLDGS